MHPTYKNQKHEAEQVYFFPGKKFNTLIQTIPPENGPVHVECSMMRNVMTSPRKKNWGDYLKTTRKKNL